VSLARRTVSETLPHYYDYVRKQRVESVTRGRLSRESCCLKLNTQKQTEKCTPESVIKQIKRARNVPPLRGNPIGLESKPTDAVEMTMESYIIWACL